MLENRQSLAITNKLKNTEFTAPPVLELHLHSLRDTLHSNRDERNATAHTENGSKNRSRNSTNPQHSFLA